MTGAGSSEGDLRRRLAAAQAKIGELEEALAEAGRREEDLRTLLDERIEDLTRTIAILHGEVRERMDAEATLQKSEARFRSIAETALDSIFCKDLDSRFTFVNQAACRLLGRRPADLVGRTPGEVFDEEDAAVVAEVDAATFAGETVNVVRALNIGGERIALHSIQAPMRDASGKIAGICGIVRDITDQRKTENALSERNRFLASVMEASPLPIIALDATGRVTFWSPAAEKLFGWKKEEAVGRPNPIIPGWGGAAFAAHMGRLLDGESYTNAEVHPQKKSGAQITASLSAAPLRDGDGDFIGALGIITDITDRKRTERILLAQRDLGAALGGVSELHEALRICTEAALEISEMDVGGVYLVNDAGGLDLAFQKGLTAKLVETVGSYEKDAPNAQLVMAGRPVYSRLGNLTGEFMKMARAAKWISIAVIPILHEGRVIASFNLASGSLESIPETSRNALEAIASQVGSAIIRIKAQAALRESEEKWRSLVESAPDLILTVDRDSTILSINRTISGRDVEDVIGTNVFNHVPAERHQDIRDTFEKVLRTGEVGGYEVEISGFGDRPMQFLTRVGPIKRDGKVEALTLITVDVSERKRAEAERRRLEEHLRQTEKMESIGKLAGGIAHDFNNMLVGVLGYASFLRLRLDPESDEHRAARTVEDSANRMADLTRQLLGFARRGKHQLIPVDLHETIREVTTLLERTIDKNVRIVVEPRASRAVVIGDPSQIHQVILNLALNGRDAMPEGGELAFRTEEADLGEDGAWSAAPEGRGTHVMVAVRDTGYGVPDEIRDRIFEPFFTTKEQGKGVGMGLATVYGITKNHSGHVEVESREGEGSVFRLFLPLSERSVPAATDRESAGGFGRDKHVLVVDDERMVLKAASELLRYCGCRVTAFSDGRKAIEFYRENMADVDLVILDMAMPGMDGGECFTALREIDPGVKAILSTGYDLVGKASEIIGQGMLGVLLKPYDVESFARKLREVFGGAD